MVTIHYTGNHEAKPNNTNKVETQWVIKQSCHCRVVEAKLSAESTTYVNTVKYMMIKTKLVSYCVRGEPPRVLEICGAKITRLANSTLYRLKHMGSRAWARCTRIHNLSKANKTKLLAQIKVLRLAFTSVDNCQPLISINLRFVNRRSMWASNPRKYFLKTTILLETSCK